MKIRVLLHNEKWTEAVEADKNVRALNTYLLIADYENTFGAGNEIIGELIFYIQYIKNFLAQPWRVLQSHSYLKSWRHSVRTG